MLAEAERNCSIPFLRLRFTQLAPERSDAWFGLEGAGTRKGRRDYCDRCIGCSHIWSKGLEPKKQYQLPNQFEAMVKNEARDQNLRSKIGLVTGKWFGLRKFRI